MENALIASGQFTQAQAEAVAERFANADTSSTVDLSGLTYSGGAVTLNSIDSALQTSAAVSNIGDASLANFTNTFNATIDGIDDTQDLDTAVSDALNDPTYGSLLKIVLADFANQYGTITATGPMMTLLTTGSNGQVTLNTTDAQTVTESVMSDILSTYWESEGLTNGVAACNRLANDVTEAAAYDAANDAGEITAMTITANSGQCTITPDQTGSSFSGSYTPNYLANASFTGDSSLIGGHSREFRRH